MSGRRLAVGLLTAATLLIGAAYGSAFLPGGAPAWAAWALAIGTAATMAAMMLLGAARRGGIGGLAWVFLLVFLWVAGGFVVALALPAANPADPTLWLGLPPRAAVLMYGIGLAPVAIVPIAYALTFDRLTLGETDLARLRAAAAAARDGSESPASGRGNAA